VITAASVRGGMQGGKTGFMTKKRRDWQAVKL